jgi:hypothetical protein
MRIIQFENDSGQRCLGVVQGEQVLNVTAQNPSLSNVYAAFIAARRSGNRLQEFLQGILDHAWEGGVLDYADLLTKGKVRTPISEVPRINPGSRLLVSGTGLTHTGSVEQRDEMHKKDANAGPKSDSRRMFELGLEGGRPTPGQRGTSPEWFYKGDARILRGPGEALDIPSFAPDGGEEPEVSGVYIIDEQGTPCWIGFVQGNEWSDHVTENVNYLYLAPSKLRTCAIGPELVTDLAFDDIRGRCRVFRHDQGEPSRVSNRVPPRVIYDSGELRTGERNMCHSLANLEDHHFKYPQHRLPGDIHVHFFGTSKLSFQHRDWKYQDGDVVEVSFEGFGAPLRNPVRRFEPNTEPVTVALG